MKTLYPLPLLLAALLVAGSSLAAEATVSVTVAYEQGVQSTAPRDWLQLLTRVGADQVDLRSHRRGDVPDLQSLGTEDRPRYRLTGVLDSRGRLTFPGGRFSTRDAGKLRDYLANLTADGKEGVLANKGRFGLTEKQFTSLFEDLSLPITFATQGESLADVMMQFAKQLKHPLDFDPAARELLANAVVTDDVSDLSRGTALAILLKSQGLVLVPTKERGQDVQLRVVSQSNAPKEYWPVGWEVEGNQREAAPKLFEFLTFEVQQHTLGQAVDAIAPRIGMSVYWDHAYLAAQEENPREKVVALKRTKSYHKRLLDRLLFQGRMKGDLRTDETGTVFYWISK